MVSHKNSIFILFKGSQTMKKTVLESGISASNAISYCFLIEQTARQLDVVFPCVKKNLPLRIEEATGEMSVFAVVKYRNRWSILIFLLSLTSNRVI